MSKSKAKTVSAGSTKSPAKQRLDRPVSQQRKEAAEQTAPEKAGDQPRPEAAAHTALAAVTAAEAALAERRQMFATMRRNIAEGVAAACSANSERKAKVSPTVRKVEAFSATPAAWSPEEIFESPAHLAEPQPSLNPNPPVASPSWKPRAPVVPPPSGSAATAAAGRVRPSMDARFDWASFAEREKGRIAAMINTRPASGYPLAPRAACPSPQARRRSGVGRCLERAPDRRTDARQADRSPVARSASHEFVPSASQRQKRSPRQGARIPYSRGVLCRAAGRSGGSRGRLWLAVGRLGDRSQHFRAAEQCPGSSHSRGASPPG